MLIIKTIKYHQIKLLICVSHFTFQMDSINHLQYFGEDVSSYSSTTSTPLIKLDSGEAVLAMGILIKESGIKKNIEKFHKELDLPGKDMCKNFAQELFLDNHFRSKGCSKTFTYQDITDRLNKFLNSTEGKPFIPLIKHLQTDDERLYAMCLDEDKELTRTIRGLRKNYPYTAEQKKYFREIRLPEILKQQEEESEEEKEKENKEEKEIKSFKETNEVIVDNGVYKSIYDFIRKKKLQLRDPLLINKLFRYENGIITKRCYTSQKKKFVEEGKRFQMVNEKSYCNTFKSLEQFVFGERGKFNFYSGQCKTCSNPQKIIDQVNQMLGHNTKPIISESLAKPKIDKSNWILCTWGQHKKPPEEFIDEITGKTLKTCKSCRNKAIDKRKTKKQKTEKNSVSSIIIPMTDALKDAICANCDKDPHPCWDCIFNCISQTDV